jgi:hypothetical protein
VSSSGAGCGLSSRHTIGPTIDSNGQLGVLFAASLGPVLGCARQVATPVRAAAGLATADKAGGLEDSGVLAFDVGIGADWLLATPRPGKRSETPGDITNDGEAPGWRLGKRLGVRTGWMSAGQVDAWTVGLSGTLALPMPRNLFSLGVEAGCDALLVSDGADAPSFRCDLGLAFDLTDLYAVDGY